MPDSSERIRRIGHEIAEVNIQLRGAYNDASPENSRVQIASSDQVLGSAETILRDIIEQIKADAHIQLELLVGRKAILPFDVFPSIEALTIYLEKRRRRRGDHDGSARIEARSSLPINTYGGQGESFAIGDLDRARFLRLGTVARVISEQGLLVPVDSSPTS